MASILRTLFASRAATNDPGPWGPGMVRWGSGGGHGNVSDDHAMRLSAVFACLRLLSENVATMPLDTFERGEDTRLPFPRPDYLQFRPPQGSLIEYLSQVMLSLLTDGNAYVATPRGPLGEPETLVVMDPSVVKPSIDDQGLARFRIQGEVFNALDVMHIKGMTLPGHLRGLSPLAYAKATADLGLQAQEFGASFFGNSAVPAGIVEAPGDAPKDLAERMAGLWDARHRGSRNAGRVGVLTGGAKFNRVTITPEESQFLATRAFQVPDIARFFGVPPHLIADASNSTSWGSGLAQQNSAFGQFSLRPWVTRIEDAHARLFASYGESRLFVRLNMDAVLRADTRERYEAYEIALRNNFLDENEVRVLEEREPRPELPQPSPEVSAALALVAKAPSLVQDPGLPALVDQLRILNGKTPLQEAPAVEPATPPAAGGTP